MGVREKRGRGLRGTSQVLVIQVRAVEYSDTLTTIVTISMFR